MNEESDSMNIKDISELVKDKKNANKGTGVGMAMLESSIRRYGIGRSILVDKNGVVIAGNKTLTVARDSGLQDILVVPSDGSKLIVHQRTDLDLLVDQEAKELAIADNRISEVGLFWDADVLKELSTDSIDISNFFNEEQFESVQEEFSNKTTESNVDEEKIEGMSLRPFEEYNYVMICCKTSSDWDAVVDKLKLKKAQITIAGKKKIGIARVISGKDFINLL